MPRHILIKLTKVNHKEQIFKAGRKEQEIMYEGIPIRLPADLSIETLQTRREWQYVLKVIKGGKKEKLHSRLFYPARISFRFEGEIKNSSDKKNLKRFSIIKTALQKLLNELRSTGNTRER